MKVMAAHSNQILTQTENHHPLDLILCQKVISHDQTLCQLLIFPNFSPTNLAHKACLILCEATNQILMALALEILAIPLKVNMVLPNIKGDLVTNRCLLLGILMIHKVKEQGTNRINIILTHLVQGTSLVCIHLVPLLQDISQTSIIVSRVKIILVHTLIRLGILPLQVRGTQTTSLHQALLSMVGLLLLGKVTHHNNNNIHMVKVRV